MTKPFEKTGKGKKKKQPQFTCLLHEQMSTVSEPQF